MLLVKRGKKAFVPVTTMTFITIFNGIYMPTCKAQCTVPKWESFPTHYSCITQLELGLHLLR